MKWKKTWFSYLLWFLYAIGISLAFAFGGIYWCVINELEDTRLMIGTTVMLFTITALIFGIGRMMSRTIVEHNRITERSKNIISYLGFLLLLGVGIGIRCYYLYSTSVVNGLSYYDAAKITAGGSLEPVRYVADRFYLALLRAVFYLAGNKILAGIILQLVLQALAAVFLYFAVRMISGNLPAVAAACSILFMPWEIQAVLGYTPDIMYLFMLCIGIWGIGLCVRNSYRPKTGFFVYAGACLLGIYLAVLVYTDLSSLILLLFVLAGFSLADRKRVFEGQWLAVVISGIAAFAGLFVLEYALTGILPISCFFKWLAVYERAFYWNGRVVYALIECLQLYLPFLLLLGIAMALYVPGFFFVKQKERFSIWLLFLIGIIAMLGFGMYEHQGTLVQLGEICCWILAGIGIQSMIPEREDFPTVVPEEKQTVTLETPAITKTEENIILSGDKEEKTETKESTETKKVKYIENPLPGPRKHIKRTMEYGFEPEEEQMMYDVKVSDEDDFDFRL